MKDPDMEPLRTLRSYVMSFLSQLKKSFGENSGNFRTLTTANSDFFVFRFRPISKNDSKSPMLGLFMMLENEGKIKVGDTVYVSRKSPEWK